MNDPYAVVVTEEDEGICARIANTCAWAPKTDPAWAKHLCCAVSRAAVGVAANRIAEMIGVQPKVFWSPTLNFDVGGWNPVGWGAEDGVEVIQERLAYVAKHSREEYQREFKQALGIRVDL